MTQNGAKSPAKRMQEASLAPKQESESLIRITLRTATGFEYHLQKPESVIRGIVDPDTPDALIEVDRPKDVPSVKHRFIHTGQIAELDVHDEMEF